MPVFWYDSSGLVDQINDTSESVLIFHFDQQTVGSGLPFSGPFNLRIHYFRTKEYDSFCGEGILG